MVLFNSAWYIPYQHHNRTHGMEATIGQKLEHNIARQSKSNVTFKHQTQYNYKDQKLHRRDKATMFLQHVKYQDLLIGCVRDLGKKMCVGEEGEYLNLTI